MSTIDDLLLAIGARQTPVFPPLERYWVYLTGLTKTGKSTLAAAFPNRLHIDFKGEAHHIVRNGGWHVWCPVYSTVELDELRKNSPKLFVPPTDESQRLRWQPPTCLQSVYTQLKELTAHPDNPVSGVIFDSMEDYFGVLVKYHEEKVWRQKLADKDAKTYGTLTAVILDEIESNVLMKGYGCTTITHLRVVTGGKEDNGKTFIRSGISESLDSALRRRAAFIWTMEKTLPTMDPVTKKEVRRISLRTEVGGSIRGELRTNLGAGNRVAMPTTFKDLPEQGAFSVLNAHYLDEVKSITSKLDTQTQAKGA